MRLLLSREVIVGFAVLGGLASLLAMVLQRRRKPDPLWIGRMNQAAYVLMGISIALFIGKGFFFPPGT
ncbi:MAG: hypothetical protein KGL70_02585 [Betaproteobacteria bacterium]|nr:hypothetical protein [Betaproteobacteria bacterium]